MNTQQAVPLFQWRHRLHAASSVVTHIAAILAVANTAFAGERHVGAGLPYPTIQAAIDAAADGDEVVVHPGIYTAGSAPAIGIIEGKQLIIRASGEASETILDGEGTARGFYLDSSGSPAVPSRVVGLTIRDVSAPKYFGSVFVSNMQTGGAAVAAAGSFVEVEACFIHDINTRGLGSHGGAGCVGGTWGAPASLRFFGCRIEACEADYGGALAALSDSWSDPVSLHVATTQIVDCAAAFEGGAIFARDGVTASLDATTITGCAAPVGGALSAWGTSSGDATITTLAGAGPVQIITNSANRGGGLALLDGARAILWDTHFIANEVQVGGSAVALRGIIEAPELALSECSCTNNEHIGTADIVNGHGSLIFADGPSTVELTSCDITANAGRGPLFDGWASECTITDCTVDENVNLSAAYQQALLRRQPNTHHALLGSVFRDNAPGSAAGPLLIQHLGSGTTQISESFFCGLPEGSTFEDGFGSASSYVQAPIALVLVNCPPCMADVARTGPGGTFLLEPDGAVSGPDLLAVLSYWGTSGAGAPVINLADDTVGPDDLYLVLSDWGADCSR